MNVAKNTVVTLSFKMHDLKANEGRSVPPQSGETTYLHGGYGALLPKVEEALEGLAVGEEISLTLAPADHFGDYDPKLVRRERREHLPADISAGVVLEGDDPLTGHRRLFFVVKVEPEWVTLDSNHPLAGQPMKFTARVLAVRPATPAEIDHGHVHGDGGHHHH